MMSVSVSERDVGTVLAKVQDDLRRLKNSLIEKERNGEGIDMGSIQSAITDAEETIRAHVEQAVIIGNNRVRTLPLNNSRHRLPPIPTKQIQHSKTTPSVLSPGENTQLSFIGKLLTQPTHHTTRQLLHDTYGVHVSKRESPQKDRKRIHKSVISGTTVSPLSVLPQRNRRDAALTPPPISSKDIQKGLLNLLERGLIPKSADIVLHPSPVQQKHVQLYKVNEQKFKNRPVDSIEGGNVLAGIKFDINSSETQPVTTNKSFAKNPLPDKQPSNKITFPPLPSFSFEQQTSEGSINSDDSNGGPDGIFKIPIRAGTLLHTNEDFKAFRVVYINNWNNIGRFIKQVEQMARDYAIPIIFFDGKKLSDLATEYELEPIPKYKELLPCILNSRDVNHLLQIPGRRYRGEKGIHAAAIKLQATYKMFVQRMKYLHYRRMKWAAGIIALGWTLYMDCCKTRKQLKDARDTHIRNYRQQLLSLRDNWQRLQTSHRVIIHLPSKGYPRHVRQQIPYFPIAQNFQLPRICDALDPNITVIYVCPMDPPDEVKDYYQGLLSSGTMEQESDQNQAWDRVHFIVPEHLESFGHHHLSLSSLLKYSPRAIKHIKRLIGGRDAYIVPHIPDCDDLEISDRLGVPLLGAEPNLVSLYSTHSGRHQFFRDAEIATPPNVREIYSFEQLVEGLAALILNNLYVRKWVFKIDHYVEGRGMAYCDIVSHLECYDWIVKESIRYGDKWKKQWAQEYARKRLVLELPTILAVYAQPVHKTLFPTWSHYLQEYMIVGGSVEASPPSDSVTAVTVDILIEPTGEHKLLSTWDQIYSGLYSVWGGSLPQTSVDQRIIEDVAEGVASSAKTRGLFGYLSVDLVTFIHPLTLKQIVWAVDIDFGPSDITAMYTLITRLANVHTYTHQQDPCHRLITIGDNEERYAIVSSRLKHSNLVMIKFNVFLQMCKSHLIAYNKKLHSGIVFTLTETTQRQYLGIICIQSSLEEALSSCAHALSSIHQEISTQQLQGQSNYPTVYNELQNIIKQIRTNEVETPPINQSDN